jgi:hypothetical protein
MMATVNSQCQRKGRTPRGRYTRRTGEVAEWLMAAVLKTAGRKPRGFESHPLRQRYIGPRALPRMASRSRARSTAATMLSGSASVRAESDTRIAPGPPRMNAPRRRLSRLLRRAAFLPRNETAQMTSLPEAQAGYAALDTCGYPRARLLAAPVALGHGPAPRFFRSPGREASNLAPRAGAFGGRHRWPTPRGPWPIALQGRHRPRWT